MGLSYVYQYISLKLCAASVSAYTSVLKENQTKKAWINLGGHWTLLYLL